MARFTVVKMVEPSRHLQQLCGKDALGFSSEAHILESTNDTHTHSPPYIVDLLPQMRKQPINRLST